MATIDITRASNGGAVITYNGKPKTISNPYNIVCKELTRVSEGAVITDGVVCKTTDEGFRQRIYKTDTITLGGVAFLGTVDDLILYLNQNVFGGTQAYAAPTKLAQTITFAQPASRVHTAPAFSANASTTSGLALSYTSSDPTKATVGASTGLITPVAAGTTDITVSQAGDGTYLAATPVVRTITLT